jgi:UDP-glucose 4-epimerase
MNILLTGASGFIGKHIANFLEGKKHSVFRITRKELDLTSSKMVENFTKNFAEKIDLVIHLAAKLVDSKQGDDEQIKVFYENIEITRNMVALIKNLKPKKLINFSSIAVYPNVDGKFSEESQVKMSGNAECMYGLAKFCSENIFDFFLKDQLPISHLRVSQVYGEGMRSDRIISIMIEELKKNNSVTVFGNGERRSDFIAIEKLLKLVGKFIDYDIPGIYNVGDESMSYLELAQKVLKEHGNSKSQIIKKSSGIKSNFRLDINKLKKALKNYL